MISNFNKIYLKHNSQIPIKTAARELMANTNAAVCFEMPNINHDQGTIYLLDNNELHHFQKYVGRIAPITTSTEWEFVRSHNKSIIISGSSPRAICSAALSWLADPAKEINRLSCYQIKSRFTMWDNVMNEMYRFSRGFDRRSHFREIARLGFNGVEVNRYPDAGYHVKNRKFPLDNYPWYMSYAPALDAFVTTSLTEPFYDKYDLERNRQDLLEAVSMAREFGLMPGFVCYEPRAVNPKIFDKYPELRGSRVDHPGRSLEPQYALDIANTVVLKHYEEAIKKLMEYIPDLRYFTFFVQDSGSGIPFASKLYFGPNGSFLARTKTIGELVSDFTETISQAGRKINPEFEVIMAINSEYTDQEWSDIRSMLPNGVSVSHPLGGSLFDNIDQGFIGNYLDDDRKMGIEPYASIIGFSGHDSEPIIGIPYPRLLMRKLQWFKKLNLSKLFIKEGVNSPPQSPYNLNQEIFAEFIRTQDALDIDFIIEKISLNWCSYDKNAALSLIKGWTAAEKALECWPRLNWYHGGVGRTQGRWLTRPLVPDISLLKSHERAAWERCLFSIPTDLARLNITFESNVRFFEDDEFEKVINATELKVLPHLLSAIQIFDEGYERFGHDVFIDQRDRFRGLELCLKTECNLFSAQRAINDYLLGKDPERARSRLKTSIIQEIENTKQWIDTLSTTKTYFFRHSSREETPFIYLTPIEDMKVKLDAMEKHINDEPGPWIELLKEPKRRKLAMGGHDAHNQVQTKSLKIEL